jgi:hypothetical protein
MRVKAIIIGVVFGVALTGCELVREINGLVTSYKPSDRAEILIFEQGKPTYKYICKLDARAKTFRDCKPME